MTRAACLLLLSLLVACQSSDNRWIVGELASDRIALTAEFSEPIVAIEVDEGRDVVAGDVVARLDDRRARARLAAADARVESRRALLMELKRGPRTEKIDQARALLEKAEREAEFRRSELERARAILDRGLGAQDRVDAAAAASQTAAAEVRVRRSELEEALAGTTIEEFQQAEARLQEAAADRDALQVDVERHVIRAPVAARVDTRLYEPGERPPPGTPLVTLLAGDMPHARVFVPAEERVHVAAGDEVLVRIDGLQDAIAGRVRWISSDPAFTPYFALTERDRGHLTYEAKIDLDWSAERLADGVPVSVLLPEATVR